MSLAAFFLFHYRDFFFGPAIFETGDYAANALNIIDAKSFRELYGHYSRWQFHHPGPAFFYCYALGEILFYDFLPVFHSPHQTHVFVAALLQGLFVSLAIVAFRSFNRSWVFLGLLAITFVVLFRHVPFAVIDIWPPFALVCPLMALIVCSAALACGRFEFFPAIVFCSGFLLSGHVAQPLFVIPIVSLAAALYYKNHKTDNDKVQLKKILIVTGIIVLIFSLPFILDIIKWPNSNLNKILDHIGKHKGESHSFYKSIGYLLTFFLFKYKIDTEIIVNNNFVFFCFLKENIVSTTLWAILIIVPSVFVFMRKKNPLMANTEGIFFRNLIIINCLALVLTIQWGHMQDGDLLSANSHLNYGIIFLTLVPLVWLISQAVQRCGPTVCGAVISLSVIGLIGLTVFVSPPPLYSQLESIPSIKEQVDRLLLRDAPQKPVLLFFAPKAWPKTLGVALALKRNNVTYLVERQWADRFGEKNVFDHRDAAKNIDVWTVTEAQDNNVMIEKTAK